MAEWTPVTEAMPQPGVTVLACYRNRCDNLRRIRAVWVPAKFEEASPEQDYVEYDEASDTYYSPEGWYEQIDNWSDYTAVAVCEGDVTHWMPMPPAPDAAGVRGSEPAAWMHEFTDPHTGQRSREARLHQPKDYELQPGDTVRPLVYAAGVTTSEGGRTQ